MVTATPCRSCDGTAWLPSTATFRGPPREPRAVIVWTRGATCEVSAVLRCKAPAPDTLEP